MNVPWNYQVVNCATCGRVLTLKVEQVSTSHICPGCKSMVVMRSNGEIGKAPPNLPSNSNSIRSTPPRNADKRSESPSELGSSRFFSNQLLQQALQRAHSEELFSLTKILDETAKVEMKPESLQARICKEAGHGVGNWIRGQGVAYGELLNDACRSAKVANGGSYYSQLEGGNSASEIDRRKPLKGKQLSDARRFELIEKYVDTLEVMLLNKLLISVYEKLTPSQRIEIDKKVGAIALQAGGPNVKGLAAPAALLVIGNLGGFATYTLMSTLLSALSLGSLTFGAYAFASSALSVVLGPVGWIGLGVIGVVKLGGPNEHKVIQLAATCAMVRQRLKGVR